MESQLTSILTLLVATSCTVATSINVSLTYENKTIINMCHKPFSLRLDETNTFKIEDGVFTDHKGVEHINYKQIQYIDVPCGKCPPCKSSTVKNWIFRLEQEAKIADSAHFVTLTYDEKHIPYTDRGQTEPATLDYTHVQDYMKAVRHKRQWSKNPIKYFAVGEYGSETYRPHWHILIFNASYQSLDSSWHKGIIDIGERVQVAAMKYILNYLQKPKYDEIIAKFPKWKGKKEMRHMSKGIGANFIYDEDTFNQYSTGALTKVETKEGNKLRLPRYYRDKLYTDQLKQQVMENAYIENHNRTAEAMNAAYKNGQSWARIKSHERIAQIQHNSRFALKLRDPYIITPSHEQQNTKN